MAYTLEIIDYFELLANEIDIKAEKLLRRIDEDDEHADELKKIVSERRKLFIDEIENVKKYNILNLTTTRPKTEKQLTKQDIYRKYCFLLDKYDMNMTHYEISNSTDECCARKIVNEILGYLVVVEDSFISDEELRLFKELLSYGNEPQENIDDLTQLVDSKFYQQIEKNKIPPESGVFNRNLIPLMVLYFYYIN